MRISPFIWVSSAALLAASVALTQPVGVGGNGINLPSIHKPNATTSIKMALFGDSFMANADSIAAGGNSAFITGSPGTWINLYTGYRTNRLPATNNFGVSGNTTTQMLSRTNTVLQAIPDIVVLEGGTNDIATSVACSTVVTNLRAMYAQFAAAGAIVIRQSIIPRSGASAFTSTQGLNAQCVNEADRRYAEEVGHSGFYFVDLDPYVTDPTQTSWSVITNCLQDGIHPAPLCGSLMGYAIAQVINQIIPAWRQPTYSQQDTYDATNNPQGNLLPNGLMTGTGGNGTGSICAGGTFPSSTFVGDAIAFGSNPNCTATVVTLGNGTLALNLALSGSYTGTNPTVDVRQDVSSPTTKVNTGDTLEAQICLNIGPNTNIAGIDVDMFTSEAGNSFHSHATALSAYTYAFPSGGWLGGQPLCAITPRRVVVASPSTVELKTFIYVTTNASSSPLSANVQFSNMSVRKVVQ